MPTCGSICNDWLYSWVGLSWQVGYIAEHLMLYVQNMRSIVGFVYPEWLEHIAPIAEGRQSMSEARQAPSNVSSQLLSMYAIFELCPIVDDPNTALQESMHCMYELSLKRDWNDINEPCLPGERSGVVWKQHGNLSSLAEGTCLSYTIPLCIVLECSETLFTDTLCQGALSSERNTFWRTNFHLP